MINVVAVTHGRFVDGIISTLEMVYGDTSGVVAFSLQEGDDPEEFENKLAETVQELNAHDGSLGTLLLVDLLGGTPSNCIARIMNAEGTEKVRCLTGLNFPMLLEAVSNRDTVSLADLENLCKETATSSVISLADLFAVN